MSEPNYVVLSTRLTEEQLADVDRIALAQGQTRAAAIRWLLADAITRFFISIGLTPEPDGASVSKNEASE